MKLTKIMAVVAVALMVSGCGIVRTVYDLKDYL